MPLSLTALAKKGIMHFLLPPKDSLIERLLADECGANLPLHTPSTAVVLAKRDGRDLLLGADFTNERQARKSWAEN